MCREERLKLDPAAVRTVLDFLRAGAECFVPLPAKEHLPDPDDRPFLEVARQAKGFLVTGNRKHFPARVCHDVCVLKPAELIEMLRRTEGSGMK